ncbi:MAG: TAT-variant-translocated molybdopterin oxidoreductase [Acidobacteria bacterium]|nr:TAT-variant-translocated molybdopterin oxidoreductase [Acidobacteriota bacterium]
MSTTFWKSLEEREGGGEYLARASAEFPEPAAGASRRDFLKLAGFGAAGALASSCSRAPVRHAVPYLSQPDGLVPGTAATYATTCGGCAAGCGLLVKTRDGRPIKIEGAPAHPVSAGGVCAVGQSMLLGLYDARRFRAPLIDGRPSSWAAVDREIGSRLAAAAAAGRGVRVLTSTVHGPAARAAIERFLARFDDGAHVEYDALSASAILDAHELTHGARVLPRYLFDRAEVIVSLDADFLGTWISPGGFTEGYARRRRPEGGAGSWHVQVESRVSLTGGKADRRIAAAPDEIAQLAHDLAAIVEGRGAGSDLARELGARLVAAPARSLVIAGAQDLDVQVLCNRINAALGNYGATLDLVVFSRQRQGSDRAVETLIADARAGKIGALLVWNANPLFDLPGAEALARVPLLVSFAGRQDETSAAARIVCPDHHPLEAWGDGEPLAGVVGVSQPVVAPLGDTRSCVETLAAWSGAPRSAREIIRDTWRERVFPRQSAGGDFEAFWDASVRAGFATVEPAPVTRRAASPSTAGGPVAARPSGMTLVLYAKPAILGGEHAYNPLLHELPDPVSKVVWDNYACVSPAAADLAGIANGDVVRIAAGSDSLELPVLVQPGQHDRVVAVAVGYGGAMTERFRNVGHHWFGSHATVGSNGRVGTNAAPLLRFEGGLLRYERGGVQITSVGRTHPLACTQDHHTLTVPARLAPAGGGRRPIVQEISLAALAVHEEEHAAEAANLWPSDHPYSGHRWGMTVDLNACTGCGACVIACQVENNIPVVGKDEVRRNREMHWIRIDRYFSEDADGLHIAQQPMLCQHCEHAPCETVCPVVATVHSSEGLNQQVYNRCVGTRYCANNCPYKTRRFNWFEYPHGEGTETLMLNPDVTVRSRGVMEKCTLCVQRIQEGKIEAKRRGEPLRDGEIKTACEQSCPAQAIVFGDLNDPESRVSRLMGGARTYRVLEELNVRPSIGYLKLVRQGTPDAGDGHHG